MSLLRENQTGIFAKSKTKMKRYTIFAFQTEALTRANIRLWVHSDNGIGRSRPTMPRITEPRNDWKLRLSREGGRGSRRRSNEYPRVFRWILLPKFSNYSKINYTLLHIDFSQELLLHEFVNAENLTDFLFVFVNLKTFVNSILTVMYKGGCQFW